MYDDLIKRLRTECILPYATLQLIREAADAIEELVSEQKTGKWIPVTERLPENEESVFVVRDFLGVKGQVPPSRYTEVAYKIDDHWIADSDEFKIARHRHTDPIYWMPLPEPPKEEI